LGFSSAAFGAACDLAAGTFGAGPWPRVSEAHTPEASNSSAIPVRWADELFSVNKRILLKK
jgi:hypothetical protein